jgi:acetylornithine/N-succinyldiaminopimelate aminotransferase
VFGAETGVIKEVRGAGLMNAVELVEPAAQELAAALLQRGLVVNAVGDHILRMLPALVCEKREIDTLLDALYEASDALVLRR